MTTASEFTIHVEQVDGYEFRVRFDKEHHAELLMDEPPPLGQDRAPNPARILGAAIGDCLSASLLFCLGRAGIALAGISADVSVELARNEERRLRIGKVAVTLKPRLSRGADPSTIKGCLERFEDFCVVTQSVRQGIDVSVHVEPLAVASFQPGQYPA